MTVGERIKTARKRAGITQEELAKRIGRSTMSVQRYESNKSPINTDTIVEIANALNVPVTEFFDSDALLQEVRLEIKLGSLDVAMVSELSRKARKIFPEYLVTVYCKYIDD